jgi:uncharacterized protein YaaW (UPF0174 family)
MAYREDEDLKFLGQMSSPDLNDLVDSLTKDKDGETRVTEELTNSEPYKKHHPDHSKYWREVAAEIQCFGANSLVTVLRGGKGVLYREVLTDVCDKTDVKYDAKEKASEIEEKLLIKFLGNTLEKMPEADRAEFAKIVGISNLKTFTPASLTAALQLIFKAGGFQSYRLTLIIANAVSRAILGSGLALATNATLMRTASLLVGPVGWALTGAWTVVDIAGPAYRVTMPSVIQIALLRRKHIAELEGYRKKIEEEMGKM